MPTYAIGDIQGCFQPLVQLLEKIEFNAAQDSLWFTGDLVNRGPDSLKTLRFIQSLGRKAVVVLGNHDFGLLAVGRGAIPFDSSRHTFQDVLMSDDKESLLNWLENQPLVHHDEKLGFTLVHAGFHPSWDLNTAKKLSKEVQTMLTSSEKYVFYQHLYGNFPDNWRQTLESFDRLRCIVNYFTRLRFCTLEGRQDFLTTDSLNAAPTGFLPWFKVPNRQSQNLKILFGHWASLLGETNESSVFALDTGCVWGNALTAMRLEDGKKWSVSCPGYKK